MKSVFLTIAVAFTALLASCTKYISAPDFPDTAILSANYAKGADVSWVSQMEASGIKFYNNAGTQQDLLQILKDKGINAIRLRGLG